MNLPNLHRLNEDCSTYITFSKALKDLDVAIEKDSKYYFTKVVAMRLPYWQLGTSAIQQFSFTSGDLLKSISINDTDPNVCFPKMIQYYMENIIRHSISTQNDKQVPEVTEIAFYKLLNKLGMTYQQIHESIVFSNDIITSNYLNAEINNGWTEIIVQIPNRCKKFVLKTREVQNVSEIVSTNDNDKALYDNGNKQFIFNKIDERSVIDFNNSSYDDITKGTFDFNILLLFYRDQDDIDKLHGINFIYPFENKVTYWDQTIFKQKTNVQQTIGYQFLFNMKTVYNQQTINAVYAQNEHAQWWNGYEKTLTSLNSFLEQKMIEQKTDVNTIPDVKLLE